MTIDFPLLLLKKKCIESLTLNVLVFVFSCHLLSAQQASDHAKYAAFYKLTYQYDSTDRHAQKQDTMILLIGDSLTLFQSYTNYLADSIERKLLKQYQGLPMHELVNTMVAHRPKMSRFFYEILQPLGTRRLTVTDKIYPDKYSYHETLRYKWTLHADSAQIAGYPCQKATTRFAGRDYTAWFTRQVPIGAGPYKFQGLPGLIVEISDADNEYRFKLTALKPSSLPISIPQENYISTTKERFLKANRRFRQNPTYKLQSPFSDPARMRQIKKRLKKRYNNYIEREAD